MDSSSEGSCCVHICLLCFWPCFSFCLSKVAQAVPTEAQAVPHPHCQAMRAVPLVRLAAAPHGHRPELDGFMLFD